jgi:hypothetical protein
MMASLMLQDMRRLYPRGATNGGICVDPDGAALGPDCVLVGRTQHGFQAIERARALALQKCIMGTISNDDCSNDDWLFRQCQRISDALNKGEIALAQIYGLRIPIGELDDVQLIRLAAAGFVKWALTPTNRASRKEARTAVNGRPGVVQMLQPTQLQATTLQVAMLMTKFGALPPTRAMTEMEATGPTAWFRFPMSFCPIAVPRSTLGAAARLRRHPMIQEWNTASSGLHPVLSHHPGQQRQR